MNLISWTKVLGQIYICGAFSHAPNKFIYTCSAHPPPTMLDTCTRYFSRGFNFVLGGWGWGEAAHFKMDNSAFFKTSIEQHRKLMQLHKRSKEFCPPLQLVTGSNSCKILHEWLDILCKNKRRNNRRIATNLKIITAAT